VRVRITAVSVIVFALAFGIAAFAMVASVRRALVDDKRDALQGTETRFTQGVAEGKAAGEAVPPGGAVVVCRLDGPGGAGFSVGGVAGGGGAPPCPGPAAGIGTGDPQQIQAGPGAPGPADADALTTTVAVPTPTGLQTFQLATPLADVQRSVDALTGVLVVGTPLLVAAVGAMVWWLVGRALRPVERLRAEVDAISHSTLDRRLRPPGSHDEIDRLARTMNGMLDRLEASAVEQRRFVSDASHELRTPLSTIRAALDVARRHPGSLPPAEALVRIDTAASRTEELVAELLELARIDESGGAAPAETVDLDGVVRRALADDADPDRVPVEVRGTAGAVTGDPAQLRRLVGNLVGNATRHARGHVTVGLAREGAAAVLTVDDDGPGIPPGARAVVFRRFARLDGARPRSTGGGGWGLGLAIAETVVRRHGGTIAIGDAPLGGARVTVRLPAAGPAWPSAGG
jgi:signal transduction histidine kinase